jgi:hypothetical protein
LPGQAQSPGSHRCFRHCDPWMAGTRPAMTAEAGPSAADAAYKAEDAPQSIPAPSIPLDKIGVELWHYDLWYMIIRAAWTAITTRWTYLILKRCNSQR